MALSSIHLARDASLKNILRHLLTNKFGCIIPSWCWIGWSIAADYNTIGPLKQKENSPKPFRIYCRYMRGKEDLRMCLVFPIVIVSINQYLFEHMPERRYHLILPKHLSEREAIERSYR
jgi:hypothetical protein